MFQAGAVLPSSLFLLQLLTGPVGDFVPPADCWEPADPPVNVGLIARFVGGMYEGAAFAGLAGRRKPLPVVAGDCTEPDFLGPIVCGNRDGLI